MRKLYPHLLWASRDKNPTQTRLCGKKEYTGDTEVAQGAKGELTTGKTGTGAGPGTPEPGMSPVLPASLHKMVSLSGLPRGRSWIPSSPLSFITKGLLVTVEKSQEGL